MFDIDTCTLVSLLIAKMRHAVKGKKVCFITTGTTFASLSFATRFLVANNDFALHKLILHPFNLLLRGIFVPVMADAPLSGVGQE